MTGRVLVISAPPPAGASPAYVAAWQQRMRANLAGRCDCGAEVEMPNRAERRAAAARGEPPVARMTHEAGCPASNEGLVRLYRAGLS